MEEKPHDSPNKLKTILVVDDDPATLELVSAIFLGGEYNVLTASSGESAVQRSRDYKSEIHLLLSDFQMPGMSGIELATKMTLERPAAQGVK